MLIAVQTLNVSVNHGAGRTAALLAVAPTVSEALRAGENVVVHCNKSFHRGPALAAGVLKAGGSKRERERGRRKTERRNIRGRQGDGKKTRLQRER